MHQALSKAPKFTAHLLCGSAKGVRIKNNLLNQHCSARKLLTLPVICQAPMGEKKKKSPSHQGTLTLNLDRLMFLLPLLLLAGENSTAQT